MKPTPVRMEVSSRCFIDIPEPVQGPDREKGDKGVSALQQWE
jgi:hypothetical protein